EVLAGAPEGQRLRPEDVVAPLREVQPGIRVIDRERQADFDAAEVVDDLFEAGEVKLDEVVDVDAGDALERLPGAARPAEIQGRVNQLFLSRLRLLPRCAVHGRAADDRDHGLARNADHRDVVVPGRDVQQHQGVRAAARWAGRV